MQATSANRRQRFEHPVRFYETDHELTSSVAHFAAEGLAAGETVILIASGPHRGAVSDDLGQRGIDVSETTAAGQLLLLDAADTLAPLMGQGAPDAEVFDATIGSLVRQAAARGAVRAFGEMVALLWDDGDVNGAIELERLWNRLGRQVTFTLLCGYPSWKLAASNAAEALHDVCGLHSELLGVAPVPDEAEATRHLPPSPAAVRQARRFVAETLGGWNRGDHADDAMLVATELATNAVIHGGSWFSVSLARSGGLIRLTVGDRVASRPQIRDHSLASSTGRGLQLVDVLSSRWGHEEVDTGKLVWAEFGTPGTAEHGVPPDQDQRTAV